MRSGRFVLAALAVLALWPAGARAAVDLDDPAAQWLPRTDGAAWEYTWRDSAYAPASRAESYSLTAREGRNFRLSWQEVGLRPDQDPSAGFADFSTTDVGLVNRNYQATPPPRQFPILCASAAGCGNSLAGSLFMTIWGTRSPVLAEPLMKGTSWVSTGGATNDVSASNRYLGRERIAVPAFPGGIDTAKVESVVSQAGALGDPFGSGLRTVWWVYGVGPVKIVFQHTGGELTSSELQRTTLVPRALPSDANLLPLRAGAVTRYRWRNSRHMPRWSTQRFEVAAIVNNTARVNVTDTAGPIDVNASYVFSTRLGGVTSMSTTRRRADVEADFPRLGPAGGPEGRWRFVTPYDLMVYGYNPVLPAYAETGQSWRSAPDSRDFRVFGVTGVSTVLGRKTVRTPAGTFRTTAVRSQLRQPRQPFGSGSRTSYFAPDLGLVKLTFRHADGSTSTVERIR